MGAPTPSCQGRQSNLPAWCAAEGDGGLAFACADGTVDRRDQEGRRQWLSAVEHRPTALCFAGEDLLLGTATGTILRLKDHCPAWKAEAELYPGEPR